MTAKEFDSVLLDMTDREADLFCARLKETLPESDYNTVAIHIALVRMYGNPEKYNALRDACCAVLARMIFDKED